MALPASGAISASQIATEFGITGTQTATIFANAAGISPTSVSASDFYGLSGVPDAQLPADFTQNSLNIFPNAAECIIYLEVDGDLTVKKSLPSRIDTGDWVNDKSILTASDFECRVTIVSGTINHVNSGTGTWMSCSTERNWGIESTVIGTHTVTFDLEVREINDTSNNDIIRITLNTEVTSDV